LAVAEYRYRLVKGTPTAQEADTILGLLELTLAASPARLEAAALKDQFLAGNNFVGLPRNLDVVPDFERYIRRLEIYGGWVGGLFDDAKNLLTATTSVGLTEAQLGIQLNTLAFTATPPRGTRPRTRTRTGRSTSPSGRVCGRGHQLREVRQGHRAGVR
jgi:hypothetical protein